MLEHIFWLFPITAGIALVMAGLKLDTWQDIKRQALRSFTAMSLGTLVFALAIELVSLGI